MPRPRLFAALAVATLAVAGCATTMNVGSFVDRSVNFTRYRTYEWSQSDALPTGDAQLERNPFFQDYAHGAIEKQMAARGFERPTSRRADLLLSFHASLNRRTNVDAVSNSDGKCSYADCRDQVFDYEAGTLVLDVVDARTKRMMWRGWAQENMEGVLDKQDRLGADDQ